MFGVLGSLLENCIRTAAKRIMCYMNPIIIIIIIFKLFILTLVIVSRFPLVEFIFRH